MTTTNKPTITPEQLAKMKPSRNIRQERFAEALRAIDQLGALLMTQAGTRMEKFGSTDLGLQNDIHTAALCLQFSKHLLDAYTIESTTTSN